MSRTLGAGLVLLGLALFVGSCVPLGFSGYRLFMANAVHVQAISAAGVSKSPAIAVATEGLARIAIRAKVETDSVQEVTSTDKTDYKARYRFPVAYRVFDASGALLVEKRTEMVWDKGEKLMTQEHTTSSGGSVSSTHNFEKFPAPASGSLAVEVDLQPDTTYGARLVGAELLVYDGLVSETAPLAAWFAMMVGGIVLGVVGLVFTVASAVAPGAVCAASPAVRRNAALCHAAGFLGYLVPLGNIVGPLVAWLAWRETDAFVDQQGKEALNFQLAMSVYLLLSMVLMLVLIGFVLIIVVSLAHLVLMIMATASAANGRPFRYPMIFRLVK